MKTEDRLELVYYDYDPDTGISWLTAFNFLDGHNDGDYSWVSENQLLDPDSEAVEFVAKVQAYYDGLPTDRVLLDLKGDIDDCANWWEE